ncbi:MAG TPA: efflux RND transporter periplasmic adaptor subunit [Usitatibacter sp.]|nr:efflux RND transporter periplasmic adaptor subunit [Usitatibacter sp.]
MEQNVTLRRAKIVTIVVLVALALGAARTMLARSSNARALEAGTAEQAKTYVKVATPKTGAAGTTLTLAGSLQGAVQSPIAARASGYVKRWTKDIGSRVEKGELLAEIESPEIDQQLSQAIAARQQADASLGLAKSTLARYEELRKTGMIPQQQLDERRSADVQAQANLAAADANVERLRQLQGFKRITAPFAGVITKRNVDVGDLIDAGGARALFILTQTDPLRIYIDVPQSQAQLVKTGQAVTITQAELRGKTFEGKVARTAGSIDPATRTMQIEVALPNRAGELLPGAYVQVSLPLAGGNEMVIPTNALMFRSDGVRVAAVDAQGKVKLLPVKVGRNFGQNIEVLDGISGDERLVLNPSDSLAEGDTVTVSAR